MYKKIDKLFETDYGREVLSSAVSLIKEQNMEKRLQSGVLVGLSGGADSVMLLCVLMEYKRRFFDFPIIAVHINHMIRGDDADRDENFSRNICLELGIEFMSRKIDVPNLAKLKGLSLEECARNVRYSEFQNIIESRSDISSIAVAHNADDNLETVILNIFRGAGTRGAAGIPPIRENIIRPLLYVRKDCIVSALTEAEIEYVTDATNSEIQYKRNRVRHNIVPELYGICEDPTVMAARLSKNLRVDDEYINIKADELLNDDCTISAKLLDSAHKAVKVRVLSKMARNCGAEITGTIIDSICELLPKDNFTYSLPGGAKFVCERSACRIISSDVDDYDYMFKIKMGKNILEGYNADLFLSNDKLEDFSLNVYKISIQADLSSAIINDSLYLRPRVDGDSIFYGGMTHKLKKLFSDRKIPQSHRKSIPVLCDGSGVLWVPGFGVRDDGVRSSKNKLYVTLAIGKGETLSEKRLHLPSEYNKNDKNENNIY